MHSKRWYQTRLSKYFDEHYKEYNETAEFYPDPSVNRWLFYIPELSVRIELTCDDNGDITELRYREGCVKL